MINSCDWIFNRKYLGYAYGNDPPFNQLIESFSCTSADDYNIEGEMGVVFVDGPPVILRERTYMVLQQIKEMPLPPFVARFSAKLLNGNMVGIADEDGRVRLLNSSKSKDASTLKEWSAHSNAVFDLAWIEEEEKLITASGDQTARLWDIQKAETLAIFRGHTCSLKTVAVQPRSNRIFITGARDGNILLWDTRCFTRNGYSNPMNTIRNAHIISQKETTPSGKKRKSKKGTPVNGYSKQSVTSIVFQDSYTVISSGACDGALKFWDLRRNYTNHKANPVAFHVIQYPGRGNRKYGYSSLVLDSTCSRLYAVCTNDIIYEYVTTNLSTQPTRSYRGHLTSSFYVKATLSPDDRFLLCGSSDNDAYIWRTDGCSSLPWVLKGHEGEVTSVAWAPFDGEKIVTCSDDNSFKVWRLFQNNMESVQKTGYCEKKQTRKGETLEDIIPQTVKLKSEEVLPVEHTNRTAVKAHLHLVTTRRIKPHLNLQRRSSKRRNVGTPDVQQDGTFTRLTPKIPINKLTPKRTPQLEILTPIANISPNAKSASTPLTRCHSEPGTPRSSRAFMETWLKSPSSPTSSFFPGNSSEISKKQSVKFSQACRSKNDHNTLTNIDNWISVCKKPCSKKNDNNDLNNLPNRSSSHNSAKADKGLTQIKSKLNPRKSSKNGTLSRKKRDIMKPAENIRKLLTASKRKMTTNSPENEKRLGKRTKQDKENDVIYIKSSDKDELFFNERKDALPIQSGPVLDLLDHAENAS